MDGVRGYDENQIALVILDFSNFATRVPIILGTPTIGLVINVMRETEMDALAMPWANARAAHLLAFWRMTPVEVGNAPQECKNGVRGYDENQIALVILDFSNFATRVPIILGTPTIG